MNVKTIIKAFKHDKNQAARLEKGISLHLRYSNIQFNLIELDENNVKIHVRQEKHLSNNYVTKDGLVQRTKELLGKLIPDNVKLQIIATCYKNKN